MKQNVFSLCLSQQGGYFSMGEINSTFHLDNEIQYIPLQSSSYYAVKINTITIDSDIINVGVNTNTIIDSGTTIAYFPGSISNRMDENIRKACKDKDCGTFTHLSDLGECMSFRNTEHMEQAIKLLPNITFEFANGVKYIWEPKDYVFNNSITNKQQYQLCVGYNQGSGGKVNLGSTWMHNREIIFDKENNRIGFVRSNCNGEESSSKKDDEQEEKKNDKNMNEESDRNICNNPADNKTLLIYCLITAIMIIIIIFLSIALYRIRRGKNCLCIKIMQSTPLPIQFDRVIEESAQL